MVDLAAIQGAITGLKAAKDVAQAMIALRDTTMIQGNYPVDVPKLTG